MEFFQETDRTLNAFLERKRKQGKVSVYEHHEKDLWPSAPARNLVLAHETAIELGNPKDFSTASLFWGMEQNHDHSNDLAQVAKKRIILVGPDVDGLKKTEDNQRFSFGKVVRVGVNGFTPENSYHRYQEMALKWYGLHLKGYMMRAVGQYQCEWVRISHDAMENGFSLKNAGGALIDALFELEYVSTVDVVFVTSQRSDVEELHEVSLLAGSIIGAMGKLNEDAHVEDCDNCDYSDVCGEVEALRALRRSH